PLYANGLYPRDHQPSTSRAPGVRIKADRLVPRLNQSADETYIVSVVCSARCHGAGGRRQDDWEQRVARTLGPGYAPSAGADVPRAHAPRAGAVARTLVVRPGLDRRE